MREAIFHKKSKSLYIFDSKNTAEWVNCPNVTVARAKIKKTRIEQKLKIV
jgi:hypothetical protein